MRRLYLHIGLGKTGTTAVQQYLAAQRDHLRHHGLHYLRAGDSGGGGHQAVAKHFIDVLPDYMTSPPNGTARMIEEIASEIEASSASAFLISSENFPLANVTRIDRWLQTLPADLSIRVIVFVRSQDELAESEYNQMVKLKGECRSFTDYVHAQSAEYDVMKQIEPWMDTFGEHAIKGQIFDAQAKSVVRQFLGCIPEIDSLTDDQEDEIALRHVANSSIGMKGLILCRLLNELPEAVRPANFQALATAIPEDTPAILMNSRAAEEFRYRYHAGNRRFSKLFLGKEKSDLGGRRYTAEDRDQLWHQGIAAVLGNP